MATVHAGLELPSYGGDIPARREMKFVCREGSFDRLIDTLEATCEPIRFGPSDVSHVHSIYFDDDRLTSIRESMAGVSNRAKIRLRWYDRERPAGTAFLEVKRRIGAVGWKHRTKMKLSEADIGSFRELTRAVAARLDGPSAAWMELRSSPVVLVKYFRRHFLDPATDARITVDWNIRGVDQLGRPLPSYASAVALAGHLVLEVKSAPNDDTAAARRVERLISRPTRSSKFVMCCARLGWKCLDDHND